MYFLFELSWEINNIFSIFEPKVLKLESPKSNQFYVFEIKITLAQERSFYDFLFLCYLKLSIAGNHFFQVLDIFKQNEQINKKCSWIHYHCRLLGRQPVLQPYRVIKKKKNFLAVKIVKWILFLPRHQS